MLRRDILTQIQSEVQSLQIPSPQIEFEVKFGSFDYHQRFHSHIDFKQFNRLKEKFLESSLPHSFQHITDYIATETGLRKQVTSTNVGTEKVIFQRKQKIIDLDIPDYDIRISANSEVSIATIEDFLHTTTRIKDRDTFFYKKHFKVDLTRVTTIEGKQGEEEKGDDGRETYEVEIEVLDVVKNTMEKLKMLNKLLKFVFLIIYDTVEMYTMPERRKMSSFINNILGLRRGSTLRYDMVAKARNLKFRDLRYGGILYKETPEEERNYYSVTHKADGIRKFLIINRTGLWLCFPPKECNLVYRFTKSHHDYSLDGLVLDGEYIPKGLEYRQAKFKTSSEVVGLQAFNGEEISMKDLEFVPEAEYWFLVFDVLCVDKNKDVQFLPHSDRMKEGYRALHRIEDLLNNKRLVVHFKSFITLKDNDSFFEVMQRMFQEKEALPYADDGLIFMSEMAPYNPISTYQRRNKLKNIPLHKRNLVDYDDICKWKPPSQLTIDFSIEKKGDGTVLLYNLNKNRELERFAGTDIHPFESLTQVQHDADMFEDLPSGAVVEMKWDEEYEQFVPIKHREDKLYPNTITVAKDVWTDVHNPITKETLQGLNFTLVRKFHNQLKRNNLYYYLEILDVRNIVDIGSGKGGDVLKWKAFNKVLAIEPNPEHIIELKHRVAQNNLEDKVHVVQAEGQDISTIQKEMSSFFGDEEVDAVTMMLSLTFFWQNQSMLTNIAETIHSILPEEGGIFAYMVMDGDVVEEMLNPYYPSLLSLDPSSDSTTVLRFIENRFGEPFASISLQPLSKVKPGTTATAGSLPGGSFYGGREVEIYIKDSIVGKAISPSPKTKEKGLLRYNGLPILKNSDETQIFKSASSVPLLAEQEPETFAKSLTEESTTKSNIIPQVEWLVHLDDLDRTFREIGITNFIHIKHRATQNQNLVGDYILNDAQKRFTSLFSFGYYFFGSTETYNLEAFFEEYNRHYNEEEFIVYKNDILDLLEDIPLTKVPQNILEKFARTVDFKTIMFLIAYFPKLIHLIPSEEEIKDELGKNEEEFVEILGNTMTIAAKQENTRFMLLLIDQLKDIFKFDKYLSQELLKTEKELVEMENFYKFPDTYTYDLEAFFEEYNRHYSEEEFIVYKNDIIDLLNNKDITQVPQNILEKFGRTVDFKTNMFLIAYFPKLMYFATPSEEEIKDELEDNKKEFLEILDYASIMAAKQQNVRFIRWLIHAFQDQEILRNNIVPMLILPQIVQRMDAKDIEDILDTLEYEDETHPFTIELAARVEQPVSLIIRLLNIDPSKNAHKSRWDSTSRVIKIASMYDFDKDLVQEFLKLGKGMRQAFKKYAKEKKIDKLQKILEE